MVGQIRELLDQGIYQKEEPDSQYVGSLILEREGAPLQGGAIVFDREGGCFWQSGEKWYQIDGEVLLQIAEEGDFYPYDGMEAAFQWEEMKGEGEIPPNRGWYQYPLLDGRLRKVALEPDREEPTLSIKGTDLFPIPVPPAAPAKESLSILNESGESMNAVEELTLMPGDVYEVTAAFSFDGKGVEGALEYRYRVEVAPISFSMETMAGEGATDPGEVVVLRVENLPADASVGIDSDLSFAPSFFDSGEGAKVALMPVSYHLGPGEYYIQLFAEGESHYFPLTIRNKEFETQELTVDPDVTAATIGSQSASEEYRQVVWPLRPVSHEEQYWEGSFILPVDEEAEVTTSFGLFRYTNGSPYAERHEAVDLSLPTGSRVEATGAGQVLYAGELQLTGNTVIIEHGFGLKSWYYHMDLLEVETGQMVAQGQKIGEVGSTGFSTGPHLHFGISVNGVHVNPYTLIQTDLLTDSQLNLDKA